MQSSVCSNRDMCFFGAYPELSVLRKKFGGNAPIMWLIPQLLDLSEFCGARDKFSKRQLSELAELIASEYYYLKISELMWFFRRFKLGDYERFYGSVDPQIIMMALRRFVVDRNDIISKHLSDEELHRLSEQQKGCVTYQEYLKLKEESLL